MALKRFLSWALVCSGFCGHASVSSHSKSTHSELYLRVLIKKIDSKEVLTLLGSKMFVGSNDSLLTNKISCAYKTQTLGSEFFWKSPFLENNHWHCSGNQFTKLLNKSTFVHSKLKKIHIFDEDFRGYLELVPKGKSLMVVNHVPLDAYLSSLLNSEMNSLFPEEALKAQIIAARSYALSMALYRRKNLWPFDLYNTQFDQVYKGAKYETDKSLRLSKETSKKILSFNKRVLKAFYHSSSGGHLELPANVWSGEKALYTNAYKAVPNPYDKNIPGGNWSISVSRNLGEQLKSTGAFQQIKILEHTEGKRVKKLKIQGIKGETTLSGAQFRALFGPGWIKSAMFDIQKKGESFVIQGKGWGHGVGMSQLGAKEMARSGKSAEQILKFYYPGANVAIYGKPTGELPPKVIPRQGSAANVSAR